jgi:glycosyltransferase involved in cell wall biosynthesis
MKLSIIVICLNEERYLARCLSAITSMNKRSMQVELLVVDGGSTDRSRAIALSHGARVVDSPTGIPVQRNLGARMATGDVIAYVDADVELLDGWFEAVERQFSQSRRKIVGGPPRLPRDASWIARAYALHREGKANESTDSAEQNDRVLSTQSLVFDVKIFHEIGGFQENLGVDEDTYFLLQAKQLGIPLISDPGLAYIHHGEPRSLREFFRRTRWGANCRAWYEMILRGDFTLANRPQYVYGAAIAVEVGLLIVSILVGLVLGWRGGIPFTIGLLAFSIVLPAARTAIRHKSLGKIGQLSLMYGAYGLATASALLGLGRNKANRWR